MDLPEEVLDEIFSCLSPGDRRSLEGCSLVSKSWLDPSRGLLFAQISVGFSNYQSWLKNIQPTNTALLRHTRSLVYFISHGDLHSNPSRCFNPLRDYLRSFCQLQALTFRSTDIELDIHRNIGLFSAFQHTLSSLCFDSVVITWSMFVALVRYFPHLRNLEVRHSLVHLDDQPVLQVPHTLRGRLLVKLLDKETFIDRFTQLKQEYEELVLPGKFEPRLINPIEGSLQRLKLFRCRCTLLDHGQH